ncbi:MAG: hypothetical protein GDA38_20850 [Hormoscilla sp. SP12CHS1]|nr:hypothetical protein [Hormoscilla sp. SP12CHS1]
MNVTSSWHQVHFHDAVVRSVEQSAEALEDFFVDAKHPDNQRNEHICLPKGFLIFKQVHSMLVRVYDSDTNNWQTLSPPFPYMDTIAEVLLTESNLWKIKGFLTDGRWLEWQIKSESPVSLLAENLLDKKEPIALSLRPECDRTLF